MNQQNSTQSTPELTPQQAEVVKALVHGATITDATKEANVDRSTFYLWLRSCTIFQAELNRAKQEQMDAMRTQLVGLVDTAVSTLRQMLVGKDVAAGVRLKAALAVLQSVGMLDPEPIAETDPQSIESHEIGGAAIITCSPEVAEALKRL